MGRIIKPHEVLRTDFGITYAYEDTRLRREYSLYFPFLLHDKKTVVTVGKGATWSEQSNSKAGDATILTFIASPIGDTDTVIYCFVGRNHSLDRPQFRFHRRLRHDHGAGPRDRRIPAPGANPRDDSRGLHLRFPDAASIEYRRMFDKVRQGATFRP